METTRYRRLLILAASIAIGLFCLQPMAEAHHFKPKRPRTHRSFTPTRPKPHFDIVKIGIFAGAANRQQQDDRKSPAGSLLAARTATIPPLSTITASLSLSQYSNKYKEAMTVLSKSRLTMVGVAEIRANFVLRNPLTLAPYVLPILKPQRLPKELLSLQAINSAALTVSTNPKLD